MTTIVRRIVCFLVGQVTLFNSSTISLVKAGTGNVFLSMINIVTRDLSFRYTFSMCKKNLLIIIFFLTTNYYLSTSLKTSLLATRSLALELHSPRFKLEVEKLNVNVKKEQASIYTLGQTLGKDAFNEFKTNGYTIKTGKSDKNFSFSISDSLLILGEVSQGKTLPQIIDLTVDSDIDYQVDLTQEYPLKSLAGEIISGSEFVFSLDSKFRAFPNQNKGDIPAIIISNRRPSRTKIAFKLNIPPAKRAGTYETILDFTALPNY